jgi:hypothetical protein
MVAVFLFDKVKSLIFSIAYVKTKQSMLMMKYFLKFNLCYLAYFYVKKHSLCFLKPGAELFITSPSDFLINYYAQ